ncbi:hypothetical protein BJV74DRAFT_933635 [Russula compacta]|nr:hypothetical protein BJV74DRAFT_933635 [Russula compacta]
MYDEAMQAFKLEKLVSLVKLHFNTKHWGEHALLPLLHPIPVLAQPQGTDTGLCMDPENRCGRRAPTRAFRWYKKRWRKIWGEMVSQCHTLAVLLVAQRRAGPRRHIGRSSATTATAQETETRSPLCKNSARMTATTQSTKAARVSLAAVAAALAPLKTVSICLASATYINALASAKQG